VVKYVKGRNLLISDLGGEANESDCEEDLPEVEDEVPKEENEERTRAVLTKGSFSAYVCFHILSLPQES
jgi:hypothetical protein